MRLTEDDVATGFSTCHKTASLGTWPAGPLLGARDNLLIYIDKCHTASPAEAARTGSSNALVTPPPPEKSTLLQSWIVVGSCLPREPGRPAQGRCRVPDRPDHQRREATSMAKVHFSRNDVGDLRARLEARGASRMLRDQPELCSDLRRWCASCSTRGCRSPPSGWT